MGRLPVPHIPWARPAGSSRGRPGPAAATTSCSQRLGSADLSVVTVLVTKRRLAGDPPGPRGRHRRAHPVLQLRINRRQRQPAQSPQETDVRPGQPRPAPQTRHPSPWVTRSRKSRQSPSRWQATGRKSSQSYDDDSSSQARLTDTSRQRLRDPVNQDRPGYEQQQHGISRTRTTAGHNPADDRPADGQPFLLPSGPYAVRIAFHVGLESPPSGSSPATCCRGASRAARASATCKCGRRLDPRAASPAAC